MKSKVTINGGYEFDFASDYKQATITGSSNDDTITARGKNLSINGGKGDDTINIYGTGTTVTGGAGSDLFVYHGGNVKITDLGTTDTLKIGDGTGIYSSVVSGKNIIVTVDDNEITLVNAKGKKTNIEGIKSNVIKDGKKVTLTEDYTEESFALVDKYSEILTVDAKKVPRNIKITGNDLMNTIIGGAGNDTLIGGTGNDCLKGGAGADVFVWNKGDGNDKIRDYTNEDKIVIVGDTVQTVESNSGNTILTLASKAKITLVGVTGKDINYTDDKDDYKFIKFNSDGSAATLKSGYSKPSFLASNYADLEAIDASKVKHGLNIVGNAVANSIMGTKDEDIIDGGKNNDTIHGAKGDDSLFGGKGSDYIYGGEGNDTLWGGTGNDFLYGNEGHDTFVFGNSDGNDKIFDYEQGIDKIMILSGETPVLVGTPLTDDITFKVGSGKITVKDGAQKTIDFIKSNGKYLYHFLGCLFHCKKNFNRINS